MKIVVISDTHDQHEKVTIPEADLLIVAGDFTCHRNPIILNYIRFNEWLGRQPVKHVVVVAGNHDTLFEKEPAYAKSLLTNATYLQDGGTEIEGLKIWGSPWISPIADWAFMLNDERRRKKWKTIPTDTDILITHNPPAGILDKLGDRWGGESIGCKYLREKVDSMPNLKLHAFGHIHESWGQEGKFVNGAQVDEWNNFKHHKPIVIEL